MFRKTGIVLLFIAVAALQTALSPRIAIFGVKPDLLLVAVVVWGITRGGTEGGVVGLGAGFLEDILSANIYIHTFTKGIAGFLSGFLQRNFGMDLARISVISVSVLTPLSYILEIMSFYFFFGRQLPGISSLFSVIVLSSIYNAVLAIIICRPIASLSGSLTRDDKDSLKEYKLYRL
jgi:rod shape-determining protein MreD